MHGTRQVIASSFFCPSFFCPVNSLSLSCIFLSLLKRRRYSPATELSLARARTLAARSLRISTASLVSRSSRTEP